MSPQPRKPKSRPTDAPEPRAIQTNVDAMFDQLPDVEAVIDARGWLTVRYLLGGWLVHEHTLYVPAGQEMDLAARIIKVLESPQR